jgi:hypothetical protein
MFDHIFPDKLTLKFLGDYSLTPIYTLSQKDLIPLKMRHLEVSWSAEKYIFFKSISFICKEMGL